MFPLCGILTPRNCREWFHSSKGIYRKRPRVVLLSSYFWFFPGPLPPAETTIMVPTYPSFLIFLLSVKHARSPQRVLNYLLRTRLSCGRMIRFLSHPHHPPFPPPFTPSPVGDWSLFLSLPVCRRSNLRTGEGGRGRARKHIIRPRGSLALYESVNIRCASSYLTIAELSGQSSGKINRNIH